MTNRRVVDHPVLGRIDDRQKLTFHFDGGQYEAFAHETVAAALLAHGIRILRVHEEKGTPRGIYCNIGHCLECRVTVDGKEGQRACLTKVKEGMDIQSGKPLPTPFKKGGR